MSCYYFITSPEDNATVKAHNFTLFFSTVLRLEQKSGRAEGHCLPTVEKGSSHRARLTGANKRMFNLLRKAKVQLFKIDQQKQLKSSGVGPPSLQAHFSHCLLVFVLGLYKIEHTCVLNDEDKLLLKHVLTIDGLFLLPL